MMYAWSTIVRSQMDFGFLQTETENSEAGITVMEIYIIVRPLNGQLGMVEFVHYSERFAIQK